jgi:hypothetical protein
MTRRRNAQTLAEFAIVVPVFIILMMGVFDLGLGIYKFNGVSQAAREIARAASVHPCINSDACTLGDTPEVAAVIAVQRSLIPNLGTPIFRCVYPDGTLVAGSGGGCSPGFSIRVTIAAPYEPITPLLGLIANFDLKSSSTIKIQ